MSCVTRAWFSVLGRREEVKADTKSFPGLEELLVEAGRDVSRGDALLLGADGDRRAVGIAAGDHEHVVAGRAVVAGEDVGRQVGADDLSDVE